MRTPKLLILLGGLLVLTPVLANAKITVHTDSSGKVHISNQESGSNESRPPQQIRGNPASPMPLRELPPGPFPISPGDHEPPEELQLPPPVPSGRQNAFNRDDIKRPNTLAAPEENSPPHMRHGRSISRASSPARRPTGAPPAESPVRVSLDEQRVLVITNLPEKEPALPAAPREHRPPSAQVPDSPVAWEAAPLAGQIIPAAYGLKPEGAHSAKPLSSQTLVLEEGTIRRFRDKKGVIRISNVAPATRKTSLPVLAAISPRLESGGNPLLLTDRSSSLKSGQPAGAQFRTVAVRRDPKGRLQIYTKEPEPPLLASLPAPPDLDRIDPALAPIVTEAANTYRLPPSLILSVIRLESNFVPGAVSPKGAMGLMQLMPGTAADLGVQEPFCPRQNIMGGSRYLRHLLNCFDGSLPLAVAAYNAGPNRVAAAGNQIPEIKETKQFVSKVLGLYALLDKMSPGRRP